MFKSNLHMFKLIAFYPCMWTSKMCLVSSQHEVSLKWKERLSHTESEKQDKVV